MMKLADWVVRAIIATTFFALLLAPRKISFPLGVISLGIVGAWALIYPQSALGWIKVANPNLDADEPSLWSVPRIIGGFFVAIALTIGLVAYSR